MDHRKEPRIGETDGFRLGDSVELMAKRQRHQELARKIKSGPVSETERDEFLRLDDALHGNNSSDDAAGPAKQQR